MIKDRAAFLNKLYIYFLSLLLTGLLFYRYILLGDLTLTIVFILNLIWISYLWISYFRWKRPFILFLNIIFRNRLSLSILGIINKRFKIIKSIFLVYSNSPKIKSQYNLYKKNIWKIWIIGLFIQNNKIGVQLGVFATEKDFENLDNFNDLNKLWIQMNTIKNMLSLDKMTFAGRLPGILFKQNINKESFLEANNTVKAIKKAIEKLIEIENILDSNIQIILLGGGGFIGYRLKDILIDSYNVISLDKKDSYKIKKILNNEKIDKFVIVNLASEKAIVENIKYINSKVIILNEVYPEPKDIIVDQIYNKNSKIYHISGVKGRAIPDFPGAYRKAIPCCAIIDSNDIHIKIIELNKKIYGNKIRYN